MSIELISKHTAGVLRAVISQPHWKKEELQKGIQEVLGHISEAANSQEEYLRSLLQNVTFLYENTNRARSFLLQCIEEETFLTRESFHTMLLEVPGQLKESNFFAENMPHFQKLVYQGNTIEEQIAHAEAVYANAKLVNDMLIDFIGTFLHPDNSEFMKNFMEYAANIVGDTVMHYCKTYSELIFKEADLLHSSN